MIQSDTHFSFSNPNLWAKFNDFLEDLTNQSPQRKQNQTARKVQRLRPRNITVQSS